MCDKTISATSIGWSDEKSSALDCIDCSSWFDRLLAGKVFARGHYAYLAARNWWLRWNPLGQPDRPATQGVGTRSLSDRRRPRSRSGYSAWMPCKKKAPSQWLGASMFVVAVGNYMPPQNL